MSQPNGDGTPPGGDSTADPQMTTAVNLVYSERNAERRMRSTAAGGGSESVNSRMSTPQQLSSVVSVSPPRLVLPSDDMTGSDGGVIVPAIRRTSTSAKGAPGEGNYHCHTPSSPAMDGDGDVIVISSESSGGGLRDGLGLLGDVMNSFAQRISETPVLRLLAVALLVLALMVGNAMQVICLNFWLRQFPEDGVPGNYTIFAVSGVIFSLFFLIALGVYVAVHQPDLSFLKHAYGWKLLLFVGTMDTLNSGLAIYAASHTAEVLQALFTALVPIYAAFFTKWILKDPRKYNNGWIRCSFTLIVTGIVIASVFNLRGHSHHSDDEGDAAAVLTQTPNILHSVADALPSEWSGVVREMAEQQSRAEVRDAAPHRRTDKLAWSFLFFLSVLPTVLMNVGQTLYMTRYTYDEDFLSKLEALRISGRLSPREERRILTAVQSRADRSASPTTATLSSSAAPRMPTTMMSTESDMSGTFDHRAHHEHHGDDMVVKLVMLAAGTTTQSILTLLLLPLDALPWFGGSDSVPAAWSNFQEGLTCLFTRPGNFAFCCLYSAGFVLVYISAAYLNQYSVTLCSMVSQMAGPITALILLIFPRLNLTRDVSPWYASVLAIMFLFMGTFLYVVWDEHTEAEKVEGEIRLKLDMLGLRPGDGDGGEEEDDAAALPSDIFSSPHSDCAVVVEEHVC